MVGHKHDLEKLERTKIPDDLEVEAKPVVAILGAGAGKYSLLETRHEYLFKGKNKKIELG